VIVRVTVSGVAIAVTAREQFGANSPQRSGSAPASSTEMVP